MVQPLLPRDSDLWRKSLIPVEFWPLPNLLHDDFASGNERTDFLRVCEGRRSMQLLWPRVYPLSSYNLGCLGVIGPIMDRFELASVTKKIFLSIWTSPLPR